MLIALEGLDGSGKTTVAQLLAARLSARYMRLPPAEMGQAAGEFFVRPDAVSRYLYYLAGVCRIDEVHRGTAQPIIADRYISSVHALHLTAPGWAADALTPWPVRPADLTVYLQVDESVRRRRLAARGRSPDPFELLLNDDMFRARVEDALTAAPHLTTVDTTHRSPQEVTTAALDAIGQVMKGAAVMDDADPRSLIDTLRLADSQAGSPSDTRSAQLSLRLPDLLVLAELGLVNATTETDARGSICRIAVRSLTPRGRAVLADPMSLQPLLRGRDSAPSHAGVRLSEGSSYVVVHGDLTHGVIASGRQARATAVSGPAPAPELLRMVEELDAMLPELPLEPDELDRARAEVSALRTQLVSPNPRPSLVRASLAGLRAVLSGVAGNAAFSGLAALLRGMRF